MKKKLALSLVLVLLMLSINVFSFAAATAVSGLTATIPNFKVTVNNKAIDNINSKYPLLVYKNITYFPMTWNYTQALGLKTSWDAVEGFAISKDTAAATKDVSQDLGFVNDINSPQKVSLANFKIKVNGKEINNASEEYPLLVFRDITYFPMTWRFAVEEFGLKTGWDASEGFSLSNNEVKKDEPIADSSFMKYEEYTDYLYDTASYMLINNNQYVIGYNYIDIAEIQDVDGYKYLYLVYCFDSEYLDTLAELVGDGYAESVLNLFSGIVVDLERYYKMDVVGSLVYYDDSWDEYPTMFEINNLIDETIEYNINTGKWEVWYPIVNIYSRMAESEYMYEWFNN